MTTELHEDDGLYLLLIVCASAVVGLLAGALLAALMVWTLSWSPETWRQIGSVVVCAAGLAALGWGLRRLER